MSEGLITAILALIGTVIVAGATYFASRGKDDNDDERADFVTNLLARITTLETRDDERDVTEKDQQLQLTSLGDEVRKLRALTEDQAAHIIVLTQWGTWAEGPVPRNPPPWRPNV